MTTAGAQPVELEALVRDAFASVAVTAYARGIDITVHIDHRLPARASGDAAACGAYLRRGLARTIEAGHTGRIAMALWREPGDAGPRIVLEACRGLGGAGPPPARLADLWALPLGGARAEPRPHRLDEHAETVLIPLPLAPEPGAPALAERWRATFQGRYLLQVRDVLIDTARMRASLAALGLETDPAGAPDQALALARRRVGAGGRVDIALLDAGLLGPAADELARAFRQDPRLADAVIVLTGADRAQRARRLAPGGAALFDAVPGAPMPWRRLLEVLEELIEARSRVGAAPVGAAQVPRAAAGGAQTPATPAIPDLAGRRILIAEDVATNQVLLRAMLAPTGAAIETVSGGDDVLARHAEAPADLIVMDLQMPGMGGFAAARHIRDLAGKPGKVPIVTLTAHAGSADRERAARAGMDAYFSKPVVVAEFYDELRRLLAADGPGGARHDDT
ncbi:MAG TPA: response regulator [Thermohalobaculum sp.]|nr:response regulator [Thermohalobaculum sp.]